MSPKASADFLFHLHCHPKTPSTGFTHCPVCHHLHILCFFSRQILVGALVPFLSGGIDTLTTAFTCLLYSLETIKLGFFFFLLFSRSFFMYQILTTVTLDLLSHLGKSKNCLLKEYSAKYLCWYTQGAHARPLIWNNLLTHTFWQAKLANWQVSFYHQSRVGWFYVACTINQIQNYIIWVAAPQRLLSAPLTSLKIDQMCRIILFILSNLLLLQAKLNGHW